MSNFRFVLNRSGVAELLKGGAMQGILRDHASKVISKAGTGYKQDIHVGPNRANAQVTAVSFKAKRDNLKNNTLVKAVSK